MAFFENERPLFEVISVYYGLSDMLAEYEYVEKVMNQGSFVVS